MPVERQREKKETKTNNYWFTTIFNYIKEISIFKKMEKNFKKKEK